MTREPSHKRNTSQGVLTKPKGADSETSAPFNVCPHLLGYLAGWSRMLPSRGFCEFRRNKAKTTKKPGAYPPKYAEDFFVGSNRVATKLSTCATGSISLHPIMPSRPLGPQSGLFSKTQIPGTLLEGPTVTILQTSERYPVRSLPGFTSHAHRPYSYPQSSSLDRRRDTHDQVEPHERQFLSQATQ